LFCSKKEKGITPKFTKLDLISYIAGDDSTATIGYKLEKIEFPASILQNSGGGLILTAIIFCG